MAGRKLNEGLAYLRRSTGKQEASVHNQLIWAIEEARRYGVRLDATPQDLDYMLAHGLSQYKELFLDDGITGSDLERPGFVAFKGTAIARREISHLFIHMPDRFARPEQASKAVVMEQDLLYSGITVVFSTRVSQPRQRGGSYFGEDMNILYSYTESGEFLNKLAIRVLESQIQLAKKGHWTGGRAPYGFVRVRVDADGTETEMADRTSIRRPGSHTEIRPKDQAKLKVWVMMLHWCRDKNWGVKRIALELNLMGIPSPDAGRTRTEVGRKHLVSGHWTPSTVRAILRNMAIVALKQYGVQSEGKHRRLGSDARPRLLEEGDEAGGVVRVVNNPADIVIKSPMQGFAPPAAPDLFDGAQAVLDARGRSQRGIAKTRDPGKYPLSTRVYDMACGYPMWARTCGERRVYTCGMYINTAGRCCDHNNIDAEATLEFVMKVLRQRASMAGGRERLHERLLELARVRREKPLDQFESERLTLERRLADLERDLEFTKANLGRAKDDDEYDAVSSQYRGAKAELVRVREQLAKIAPAARPEQAQSPEAEAELALALFDSIEQVAQNPEARAEIRQLIQRLNLNLWLNFSAGKKGTRDVRVLTGGLLTTGNDPYPVQPYGDSGLGHGDDRRANRDGGIKGVSPSAADATKTSSAKSVDPAEDVSLCKAHRGERI